MLLRITWKCKASENVRDFDTDRLVIGRFGNANIQGLDLSADTNVSRQHAVIDVKDNIAWLTDLGSRFGTQVNGGEIRGLGEKRLWPGDTILIGQTTLRVNLIPDAMPDTPIVPVADSKISLPGVKILKTIKTDRTLSFGQDASASATAKCLAMVLDLPRQFAAQARQSELLQTVMNRVVEAIPCARRGALLMCDPQNDALLLKAYVSPDEPAVSETLARRALNEKRGFIWRSSVEDTSQSLLQYQVVTDIMCTRRCNGRSRSSA